MKTTLKPILKKQNLLHDLPEAHLDLLAGCAANARFERGDYMFRIDEPAEEFYLIRQGRVALELPRTRKETAVVQTVDENSLLGWSWLVAPYRWHFSARVMEPVLALRFDGKCLRAKAEKDHELGYELYRRFLGVVAERLNETLPQVVGLYR
ncbi:MAG: cyclic nucleotide-binding domain-containing protein [Elusimicrobia bacterium]|nr:cyclic nucleotide-binding domain-containing protein [Elusimicrobiota bacterium]